MMCNLTNNISPVRSDLSLTADQGLRSSAVSGKINGLSYVFDPSKNQQVGMFSFVKGDVGKRPIPISLQVVFPFRQENSPLEKKKGDASVYQVELFESQNLDAEEEFEESSDQEERETMEKEDSYEEMSSFEQKPSSQEGGFEEGGEKKEFSQDLSENEGEKKRKKMLLMWKKTNFCSSNTYDRKRKDRSFFPLAFSSTPYVSFLKK